MAGNGGLNAMEEAVRGEPALLFHTWCFSDLSGRSSDDVDIFNVKSETWTTAVLSAARYGLAATSLPMTDSRYSPAAKVRCVCIMLLLAG